MSSRSSVLLRLAGAVSLAAGVVALRPGDGTSTRLAIQPYAGLTITGIVGAVYSLEYIPDVAQTNNPASWHCLEYFQLPANPSLWVDRSAPATGRRFYRSVLMPAPTNMVFIPPGRFRMGSGDAEWDRGAYESPETVVTISQGFWMGEFEVTGGEYEAVMGNNPSWFSGDATRPVERVTWFDATRYCRELTRQERTSGRIAANAEYRLPTEAEWEYACRAWTLARFGFGDDLEYAELPRYAWFSLEGGFATQAAGQKLPNRWGLKDIHGNVREWCCDWFDAYPGGTLMDPRGPTNGLYRVVRGGGWCDNPRRCRSADRSASDPAGANFDIGFRVVLVPGTP